MNLELQGPETDHGLDSRDEFLQKESKELLSIMLTRSLSAVNAQLLILTSSSKIEPLYSSVRLVVQHGQ
tara:strand:+ start:44 stop:250 length:207 start_codon:yes stop_codon:yes gene_type:complete